MSAVDDVPGSVKLRVAPREGEPAQYDLLNDAGDVLLRISRQGRLVPTLRYTLLDGTELATTHGAALTFLDIPLKSFRQSLTSGTKKRWYHPRNIFVFDSIGARPVEAA